MTLNGWLQIALFCAVIFALTKPVGIYLHRVFEGPLPLGGVTGPLERLVLRLCGSDGREQTWKQYTLSMVAFSVVSLIITYAIMRLQNVLPFNPQGFDAVAPDLAFNTAASFTTNTNWQNYGGETVMSYFSQMVGLTWHNFHSAGVGIGVALAAGRGLTRAGAPGKVATVGNFWVDLVRGILFVLLPACVILALILISQGVIQNFGGYVTATMLDGGSQVIPMGPVASQEAIKELGTNGGGFFNANSAHPFENPTPFSNLIEMLMIFAIPAGLTYTWGRMCRNQRQGWAIFAAMSIMFLAGITTAYWAESHQNAALAPLALDSAYGNMEGKEVRFGIANSALFATVTTDTSCGAVNSMHDSFTALGGLVPMFNLMLSEVVFGGVGAGLYGMLIFIILSVFIAGLMVGRTPEYLGKKIEAREMKLVMFHVLIYPLVILVPVGISAIAPAGLAALQEPGAHGMSELIYAFTSMAANNGSAFAGLSGNSLYYNAFGGFMMLAGRFLMIVPIMAIAGSMGGKRIVQAGPGTFPTDGWLFTVLLVGVVIIVGALTFFPAVSLGPILEHFQASAGKVF